MAKTKPSGSSDSDIDLIVPVYLNQRVVFDLVAMLEGGIAAVNRVVESEGEATESRRKVTGSAGLSNALSQLVSLGLSASTSSGSDSQRGTSIETTRVHTTASLFFTLRRSLVQRGLLRVGMDGQDPRPGEFFELAVTLHRNPLLEGLEAVIEILDLVEVFEPSVESASAASDRSSTRGKKKPRQPTELQQLRGQLDSLVKALKAGGSQDLVATVENSDYRAIVGVDDENLEYPAIGSLADGTYRVLGKVIQVRHSRDDSLSLLRKTAMRRLPASMLSALRNAFDYLVAHQGFDMPEMDTDVHGPVVQLLPVAIFA